MKKKLTIYLSGGLGNNLFQMAHADFLEDKYDITYNTFLQKQNWFTKILGWSIHPTDVVDVLLMNKNIEDRLKIKDYVFLILVFLLSKLKVIDLYDTKKAPLFLGRTYSKCEVNVQVKDSFLVFLKNKMDVSFKADKISEQFCKNILHVRRGDFSSEIQLDFDYYKKAISKSKKTSFILISNDSSVIEEFRLKFPSVIFINSLGKSQNDDFLIMSKADTLILSNSTYSYWASQVCPVDNVIYPSRISSKKVWSFPLCNKNRHLINSFCDYLL